jgi:thiol-disulfide isomerase/thioredoxin
MSRRLHLGLWLAGGAALAAGAGVALWRHPAVGPTDDAFWSLRFERPEGGELALASFRGKPLVINFWATWCPPCIKELPAFDQVHRTHGPRGVQVIGLAVDGPTPVRQFLARQPVSFPIGLAGLEGTNLTRELGNTAGGLPFTVVFDRQGTLRHRKLGQTAFDELAGWIADL